MDELFSANPGIGKIKDGEIKLMSDEHNEEDLSVDRLISLGCNKKSVEEFISRCSEDYNKAWKLLREENPSVDLDSGKGTKKTSEGLDLNSVYPKMAEELKKKEPDEDLKGIEADYPSMKNFKK